MIEVSCRTALGCALLVAACSLASGCGPERLKRTPVTLLGRWESEAPRYADRWLEIRPLSVIWGVGTQKAFEHAIDRIVFEQERGGPLVYHIHYTEQDQGYEDVLRVTMTPGLSPVIQLGSRKDEWHPVR